MAPCLAACRRERYRLWSGRGVSIRKISIYKNKSKLLLFYPSVITVKVFQKMGILFVLKPYKGNYPHVRFTCPIITRHLQHFGECTPRTIYLGGVYVKYVPVQSGGWVDEVELGEGVVVVMRCFLSCPPDGVYWYDQPPPGREG